MVSCFFAPALGIASFYAAFCPRKKRPLRFSALQHRTSVDCCAADVFTVSEDAQAFDVAMVTSVEGWL